MTQDRLAEWGVVVFTMSVLAWVIYRLTWLVLRLVDRARDRADDDDQEG